MTTPAARRSRAFGWVVLIAVIVGGTVGFIATKDTADRQCKVIDALRGYVLADTAPLHVPGYVEPGVSRYLLTRDELRRANRAKIIRLIPEANC